MSESLVERTKPEIPNGVVARILKLDEDLKSKKYRVQRDAVKAMNVSMALFVKLLTKTCDLLQSSSGNDLAGARARNTIDVEHLVRAINRYDVLEFLKDYAEELEVSEPYSDVHDSSSVSQDKSAKRSLVEEVPETEPMNLDAVPQSKNKKLKSVSVLPPKQASIKSFFEKSSAA